MVIQNAMLNSGKDLDYNRCRDHILQVANQKSQMVKPTPMDIDPVTGLDANGCDAWGVYWGYHDVGYAGDWNGFASPPSPQPDTSSDPDTIAQAHIDAIYKGGKGKGKGKCNNCGEEGHLGPRLQETPATTLKGEGQGQG